MNSIRFLTLLFMQVVMLSAYADSTMPWDKGFRLPLQFVSKNYRMMRLTPSPELIKNHIIKSYPKIDAEEAEEMSEKILTVSLCMAIDPWILTGLIQKESSFMKDAVSRTGAAGLTQFTNIGIKEVNDQLGLRGKFGAPEENTTYFLDNISGCIDPNWIHLWERVSVKEEHPEFYELLKAELKKDIAVSITYGAILLKTFMAFVDTRNTLEAVPLKTSEMYFQALQLYNGEEGDLKVKYAKDVFRHLKSIYPDEVNFPF